MYICTNLKRFVFSRTVPFAAFCARSTASFIGFDYFGKISYACK